MEKVFTSMTAKEVVAKIAAELKGDEQGTQYIIPVGQLTREEADSRFCALREEAHLYPLEVMAMNLEGSPVIVIEGSLIC